MNRHATLVSALVIVATAAIPNPARAQAPYPISGATGVGAGWRFRPGVTFGYDSFGQRYVLGDRDTLDLLDELSARLTTAIQRNGRTQVGIKNTFGMGQQTTRDDLLGEIRTSIGRLELRGEQELHYRGYTRGSDFVLSSDYLSGLSRVAMRAPLGERWRLRVEDRFEWTAFDSTSRYNYDERRNDASAEIERQYGIFSHVDLGYAYGVRSVPDSSSIDYRRHVLTTDWQHDLGRHDLLFEQRLERRLYRDASPRSDLFDYSGNLAGVVGLHPALRLRPQYRATVYRFDRPDSLYADYTEQSVELLVEGDAGRNTILALGPRAEFRRGASTVDRPYNQWGLQGSVTYTLGTTLWLQFTDEIGSRMHLAGDDLLFTDYYFNWSTLYLTWKPLTQLGLDLFFGLDPEVHEESASNNTLLLISTSITYGWR